MKVVLVKTLIAGINLSFNLTSFFIILFTIISSRIAQLLHILGLRKGSQFIANSINAPTLDKLLKVLLRASNLKASITSKL